MSKNYTKNLPSEFVRNIIGVCGENGARWLEDLPRIIDEMAEMWTLEVKNHFPNLSYNYVAPCKYPDGEAVLKIGLPEEKPEIFYEAEYLRACKGKGAVEILKFDEKRRAALLEKLSPGENLKQIFRDEKEKAVEPTINIMRRIEFKPQTSFAFRRLEDWFNGFEKAIETDFPNEYVKKASRYFAELNADSRRQFILHGDLHHENILSAEREPFLAIDPKGIVGDIGYEIAVFLNNHARWLLPEADYLEKLNIAVRQFSDAFGIARQDVRKWAYAQTVLSAWWTFEESSENWKQDLAFSEIWDV